MDNGYGWFAINRVATAGLALVGGGGQVGIGDHAKLEAGTMLGGQAGILPHKVLRGKGILYWGTPAKPVREYLKELALVTRLARKAKD